MIDNRGMVFCEGCQIPTTLTVTLFCVKFTSARSVWNSIIRPEPVIPIATCLQLMITAAADLIKECLSLHGRSHAAVWQISVFNSHLCKEALWHQMAFYNNSKEEGLKVPASDCAWIMMPFYMHVCPSRGNYLNNVYVLVWRGLWHIVPRLMTRNALRPKWGF